LEVRSLLKEIRTIGQKNLANSLPADLLARADRIMQQVKGASGHGTKDRTDK